MYYSNNPVIVYLHVRYAFNLEDKTKGCLDLVYWMENSNRSFKKEGVTLAVWVVHLIIKNK